MDNVELQEINLGLPVLKEVGAKWLVNMAEYIADNPQFIVNLELPVLWMIVMMRNATKNPQKMTRTTTLIPMKKIC